MSKVIYLVSARSFSSESHMRKIAEVIKIWTSICEKFYSEFGGDYLHRKKKNRKESFGDQSYFDSYIRTYRFLDPVVISISELKDIIHNAFLKRHIVNKYKNIDLDYVIERSCRLHDAGLVLAKVKGVPYVLEWKDHLVDYSFSLFRYYALYIETKKIQKASYIIVESDVLKRHFENQGIDSSKIKVALNAVNANEFKRDGRLGNELREKLNICANDQVVGYLGSYTFYHNTEMLVHLAKIILQKSDKWKFLLVGNGRDFNKCEKIAENLGILNNGLCMINGVPKSEVPRYLSAMDYAILPGSTKIICPIKIMEYMAASTVVLAPNYDCIQEVIEHNVDGYLFDDRNYEKLALAILKLSKNQEKVAKMSLRAEKKVSERFTWERTWGSVLMDIITDG